MTQRPQAELSRRYHFSASHRLHIDQLSADRNRDLFGKCNNPFGHGHNYTIQLTLRGPVDAETGMVVNLADLDAYVRREIIERFDCANLNEEPLFGACVPSTENLAVVLWRMMAPFEAHQAPVRLHRVRVEETSNNAFDFYGESGEIHRLQAQEETRTR